MDKNQITSEDISQEEISKVYVKVITTNWSANVSDAWVSEPRIEIHELVLNDKVVLTEIPVFFEFEAEIQLVNITSDFVGIRCLSDGVINRNTVSVDDWENRYRWTDKVNYGEECELFTDTDDAGTEWTLIFSKEPFED